MLSRAKNMKKLNYTSRRQVSRDRV